MKKKNKKAHKFYKILSFILVVFTVLASSVLVYFDAIPNKFLIPGIIVLGLIVLYIALKLNKRTCLFTKILCVLFSTIIVALESFGMVYAFGTIDFLNEIFDTGLRTEVYNVYVLNDSSYKKLSDIKNKKVIIYKSGADTQEDATKKLSRKVKIETEENDSLYDSVDAVVNGSDDALFVSESLMGVYQEEHENGNSLRSIGTIEVASKTKSSFKTVNVTKKPFVVYLSGVDTSGSINKVSRSDVNILAFINPDKGKVLLVSTPRDYYVTLASKHAKDKLTHAGIYGIEESAHTLGNLYGEDVNYYARVNFTSFVNIIDKLGGITVDVEKPDTRYNDSIDCGANRVCEQNSQRAYGDKLIYVNSGIQTLNGEQALAYSRDRHQYTTGDIARGKHQQQVIEGIIKKAASSAILTKYNSLLSSLSKGVLTNVEQKTITKLVNMQLDENIKWQIDSVSVTGTGASDTTYSTGRSKVYVMIPDEKSMADAKTKIQDIMKED